MPQSLSGKVALVTGAGSGIGRACAERLAAEGAVVIATDIDETGGRQTVTHIHAADGEAHFLRQDVSDEAGWQTLLAWIREEQDCLHILVNNAGIGVGGSILEMSLAEWRRQQAINLDGVFLGMKHCIPLIRDSGGGSIINMSSVAGLKGSPNLAAYCATKGGVRLLTKAVALECAGQRWPVRVNSVHPGVIDTPIWTKVNPEYFSEGANAVDVDAMAELGVPMGLPGKAQDIANGVLFLASDESSYMTGTELVIDGGITA
ncbi:MAG: glucose 1-dehydrogenase [Pseudomonadales bacterium]|nr:glucose 1-dehydrogenase [Pseudomonadales bacterium]